MVAVLFKFPLHDRHPHVTHTHKAADMVWDTAAERERERERPHISLMPSPKYGSKSHTSSGPRGGALDEFSPCILDLPTRTNPPLSARLFVSVREGASATRAERRLQQQCCSPPAPVFIPVWALDVITAQRSTLTETESSQRQQEWLRDIRRHTEREQRGEEEHNSFVPSAAATVIQECPLLLRGSGSSHTQKHTLLKITPWFQVYRCSVNK